MESRVEGHALNGCTMCVRLFGMVESLALSIHALIQRVDLLE